MELSVSINGETYRAAWNPGYSITNSAGAVSTSSIDIEVGSTQSVPRSMALCIIYDSTTPIFRGIVQNVSSPAFASGEEVRRYRIEAQSMECVFNNRLVSEAYENKYTHEIVQSLYDNYIAEEGIDFGAISTTEQLYDEYNCQYTRLADVLTELAEDLNASYYISPDNKFYFLTRNAFLQIDAPTHITGLQLEEETGDLRSVQIVTGATEKTSTQTENAYWQADQTAMTLGYQVAAITGVTINAVPAGVGQLGVDEADTSKTFLYAIGSNTLTVNANASVKPTEGQNVVIVYQGYYDIVVVDTNDSLQGEIAALNGTSGKIENVFTDETIRSFSDADKKALALLDQYNTREQTVSCVCQDIDSTSIYTMWYINRPDLNIVGQYVVTEREITPFGHDAVLISVKLKNKGFFARYGTVIYKKEKSPNETTKIYKTAVLSDTATTTDAYVISALDLVAWPTDGAFIDPLFDTFYPGV